MKKYYYILLIVVLAAIVGGLSYWRGRDQVPTPVDQLQQSQTANEDISNWKTYENKELGFKFKYPSILSVIEPETWNKINGVVLSDKDHNYILHVGQLDIPEYKATSKESIESPVGFVKPDDIEVIKVGTFDAFRFRDGGAGCGGNDYRIAQNASMQVRLAFVTCGNNFEFENKILSTFDFIFDVDAGKGVSTVDWNTYQSEKYQFKYPLGWSANQQGEKIQLNTVATAGVMNAYIERSTKNPQTELLDWLAVELGVKREQMDKVSDMINVNPIGGKGFRIRSDGGYGSDYTMYLTHNSEMAAIYKIGCTFRDNEDVCLGFSNSFEFIK